MAWLDILSLMLSAVPTLSFVVVAGVRWSRHRRERSLFNLSLLGRVDVVVATVIAHEKRQGKRLARPATGLGQVVGVSHVAAFLAHLYRHKKVNIVLSRSAGRALDEDVILLGAPISNTISRRFLQALAKRGTLIDFDSDALRVAVPNKEIVDYDLERSGADGIPGKDVGLIVVAHNPWEAGRRAILCCGFSTFGTGAAASYLFGKLPRKDASFWEQRGIDPRRSDGFGMLVEVCFDELGHAFEFEPKAAFEITDPEPKRADLRALGPLSAGEA